jgi:hypothetical protein
MSNENTETEQNLRVQTTVNELTKTGAIDAAKVCLLFYLFLTILFLDRVVENFYPFFGYYFFIFNKTVFSILPSFLPPT